jgi:hypothetical protein
VSDDSVGKDSGWAGNGLPAPGSCDDWPFVWASVIGAVTIFVGLSRWLAGVVGSPTVDASRFIPDVVEFLQPEPLEKARYLMGLLCIPTIPTALYVGLRSAWAEFGPVAVARLRAYAEDRTVLACRDVSVVAAGGSWLAWLAVNSDIPNACGLLVIAAASGMACWIGRATIGRILAAAGWVIVPGLLLLAWWDQLIGEEWFWLDFNIWHHVDILLGAVNQVAHGKTILVDTSSQYGILYPYIAAAAAAPFGVGVVSLAGFFATLGLVQIVLAYLAIARLPSVTGAWRTGFLAIYCGLAVPMLGGALFNLPDTVCLPSEPRGFTCAPIYYQYFPLRTFWPTVFIWFVPLALASRNRWMMPLGYVLAGVAFLWNADTGLLCLVAYAGACGYMALAAAGRRPLAACGAASAHAGAASATVALALAAYAAFAWLRSGSLPDFGRLLRFQEIFYAAGFFMLPLPTWELWQPIIAIYAVTVAWAMRRLVTGRATRRAAWMLFIALYGLGAFSYYQGRSMATFLPSSFPPAAILAMLWLHAAARRLPAPSQALLSNPRLRSRALVAATAGLFCMFGIVNLLRSLPMCLLYAVDFAGSGRAAESAQLAAAFAPELVGRPAVIFAEPSNYFHVHTGSWSALPFASPTEVFLRSQVVEAQQVLDRGGVPVILHPRGRPKWSRLLDLRAYRPVREYPGGFVLLRHASDRHTGIVKP